MNEESSSLETITLRPSSVPCFNFKKNGRYEKRTAIIVPVRFTTFEDGSIRVAWACSNGRNCENRECLYSKASKNNFIENIGENKNETDRERRNRGSY